VGSVCHRRNRFRVLWVPLDPVLATYIYQNRSHALLYPLMAAAGSAAGCMILYWIGYRGGEVLLIKIEIQITGLGCAFSPEFCQRLR